MTLLLAAAAVCRAQALSSDVDTWTTEGTATTSNLWGITGVQDTLVAVGEAGIIETYRYAEGLWKLRPSGTAAWLTGAASNGSRVVAVGESGTILTSDDLGDTWTARRSGTTERFNGVAFGAGTWLAIGEHGTTFRSNDGITWTMGQVLGTGFLRAIAFGQGQFLVGGEGGALYRSSDGVAFTQVPFGATSDLEGIAISDERVWVVGSDGLLATSGDLASWRFNAIASRERVRAVTVRNAGNASATGERIAATYVDDWRVSDPVAPAPPFVATAITQLHGQVITVGFGGKAARSSQSFSVRIRTQPERALYGQPLVLRASAPEPGTRFQWLQNGSVLAGATNPTFTVASATPAAVSGLAVQLTTPAGASTTVTPESSSVRVYPAGQPNPSDPEFKFGIPTPAVIAPTAEGKYLAAGPFSAPVAGRSVTGLVRLAANGDIDPTFKLQRGVPVGGWVNQIFPLPDGRAVVFGAFSSIDGQPRPGLARLLADGSVDPAFAPPSTLALSDVLVSPGGTVWARSGQGVVQLLDSGAVNTAVPEIPYARLVATDSRERLLVAIVTPSAAPGSGLLVRYLPSGIVDPTYQTTTVTDASLSLRLFRGVSGDAGVYQLQARSRLPLPLNVLRVRPDGGLDPNYNIEVGPNGTDVFVAPDGTLLVVRATGVVDSFAPTGEFRPNVYLTPADQHPLSVLAFGPGGSVITSEGRLRPIVGTAALSNVSLRAQVATPSDPLIAGFALRDAKATPVLVRAVGPTLKSFDVSGALTDPQLSIVRDGNTVAKNDDWSGVAPDVFASVGAFALPPASKDAAVVFNASTGGYTGVVAPVGEVQGTALAEVYRLPGAEASEFVNVSGRSPVSTGTPLIAGFTLTGVGTTTVLIRAVGPSLAKYGVAAPLAHPRLVLYRGAVALSENTGWGDDPAVAALAVQVGAFSLERGSNDCAIRLSLGPGSYTAVISSGDGTPGAALAEVYTAP